MGAAGQKKKSKAKRKVFWVRKPNEQLNGSKFESPDNFTDEGDGVRSMHHVHASHELGMGAVGFRRIPCHCEACSRQMKLKWDNTISRFEDQPRFADVDNCKFKNLLSDRNKWHFVHLKQRSENHRTWHPFMDEDANLLRAEIRNMIGSRMMLTIREGHFGAVVCDDDKEEHGHCVVERVGVPWTDQKTHQLMCNVIHWDKVPNSKH